MSTGVCAVRDLVTVPEGSSAAGAQGALGVLVALVPQAGSHGSLCSAYIRCTKKQTVQQRTQNKWK